MSKRSRSFSLLIGSLIVMSLLASDMCIATAVSVPADSSMATVTKNIEANTTGECLYRLFLPNIFNNTDPRIEGTPTKTIQSAPTTSLSAVARIYYVSTSGSDSNPGTLACPWRTIQEAANSMSAGDTVEIRAGTYNERVLISRSGNATEGYIVYKNYTGETPIIDGTGIEITPSAGLINMLNVSYIKIVGLKVTNSDDAGIYVRRAQYIVVQDNITQNTVSSGVGIWNSDNILVDSNTVVDARNVDISQGGHEESISISSTKNFEVRNNDVSLRTNSGFLGNEGIDIKDSSQNGKVHHNYVHNFPVEGGAIYVDAWSAGLNGTPSLSNIEIYCNVVENAGPIVIGSERGGTAENIKIYNNLVINGPESGIEISNTGISNTPYGDGLRKKIEIFSNTVYKVRWSGGAGILVESANISNIVIRNNITYMNNYNGEIVVAVPSALVQVSADHNLVYGPKHCSQAFPNCVEVSNITNSTIFGNITADPKFTDLSSPDLHLATGSPGIDSGVSLAASGVVTDFDGVDRPQGGVYDMGAYER